MNEKHAKLIEAMTHYDRGDTARIQHFIKVHDLSAVIGTTVGSGGCLALGGGDIEDNVDGVANRTRVNSGGSVIVCSGCTASELSVSRGGVLVFDVASNTDVQGASYGSAFEMTDAYLSGYI